MPTKGHPGLAVVTRRGSRILYLRGTVRGRYVHESTRTDNAALAEEARAAREAELYRSAIHGTKIAVTFAAAAESYLRLEQRSPATCVLVRKLLVHFGPKATCEAIDQAAIDRAGRALCRPDSKRVTILRHVIAPSKAILTHAARRGWCELPMFEKVKGGGRRTDWFTPAEAEAMVAAASDTFRPLLVFLFCTGARLGEAIDLEWVNVDLPHSIAVFRGEREDGSQGTKSGNDRVVDLPPRAVAALANLPGDRIGRVFRHRSGKAYRSTSDSATVGHGGQIRRAWATALRLAGVAQPLTPHHARHAWATWHYCVNRDPMRLRDEGGWATLTMVERYTKLAPEWMRDEVLAFWGCHVQREGRLTDRSRAAL